MAQGLARCLATLDCTFYCNFHCKMLCSFVANALQFRCKCFAVSLLGCPPVCKQCILQHRGRSSGCQSPDFRPPTQGGRLATTRYGCLKQALSLPPYNNAVPFCEARMHAIQLEQPGRFRTITIPEPAGPGASEALVRVHRVGICGTDISGYLGKMPFYSYPRIPGHELGVEVTAVGSSVENVRPGDRCSVEPYMNCQNCFACRRGRPNCCEHLEVLGVHTDGGLRPQFIVPARKLHSSKKLTLDQLALVEPLGIGCHAVDRGAPQAGEHVLVVGAGPIGLSVIEFAKLTGATITVLDLNQARLDFCKRTMGVNHTIQMTTPEGALEEMRAVTGGTLFPVVFDATGNTRSMCGAFEFVAFTGRIVFVGIVTDAVSFPD